MKRVDRMRKASKIGRYRIKKVLDSRKIYLKEVMDVF